MRKLKPLYRPRRWTEHYDEGTENAHSANLVSYDTYLNSFLDRFCWFIGNMFMVTGFTWSPNNGKWYDGTGFYMSSPVARRLRWVWRGESKYSLFWGNRTKNGKIIEWSKDGIRF